MFAVLWTRENSDDDAVKVNTPAQEILPARGIGHVYSNERGSISSIPISQLRSVCLLTTQNPTKLYLEFQVFISKILALYFVL